MVCNASACPANRRDRLSKRAGNSVNGWSKALAIGSAGIKSAICFGTSRMVNLRRRVTLFRPSCNNAICCSTDAGSAFKPLHDDFVTPRRCERACSPRSPPRPAGSLPSDLIGIHRLAEPQTGTASDRRHTAGLAPRFPALRYRSKFSLSLSGKASTVNRFQLCDAFRRCFLFFSMPLGRIVGPVIILIRIPDARGYPRILFIHRFQSVSKIRCETACFFRFAGSAGDRPKIRVAPRFNTAEPTARHQVLGQHREHPHHAFLLCRNQILMRAHRASSTMRRAVSSRPWRLLSTITASAARITANLRFAVALVPFTALPPHAQKSYAESHLFLALFPAALGADYSGKHRGKFEFGIGEERRCRCRGLP